MTTGFNSVNKMTFFSKYNNFITEGVITWNADEIIHTQVHILYIVKRTQQMSVFWCSLLGPLQTGNLYTIYCIKIKITQSEHFKLISIHKGLLNNSHYRIHLFSNGSGILTRICLPHFWGVKNLLRHSMTFSSFHLVIFFPLALQSQFWPWPTSMKLSVSLRFTRS
jgi:hypothetical protein